MHEYKVYVDEDETIYANNEIVQLANVNELLKTRSLDELLRQDALDVEKAEENVTWYHGNISRQSAESILKEAIEKQGSKDGLFLVWGRTSSKNDFSLSLVFDDRIYHFQIHQVFDGVYQMEDGRVIHGLDQLIVYYNNGAHELPTKLSNFCKAWAPPSHSRKYGVTNLLHRAVLGGDRDLVHRVLCHTKCPKVNAKDSKGEIYVLSDLIIIENLSVHDVTIGSAALHIAAFYGFDDVIDALLDYSADVKLLDTNGHTALHRACVNNNPKTIAILMRKGCSNVQARCPRNGWVPLHVAAMKGHIVCIKMLLLYNATHLPRSNDNKTPWDLAEQYGRQDCVQFLDGIEADLEKVDKIRQWPIPLNPEEVKKVLGFSS
ncbi:tyrosine-protein kinase HTK16-like [Gigantopelta aegis]|uniref:tyrosine-protein kinase HTK16-like n=1 Tax=Gigantopelta aegis TaxID=1735272 RepID=UPI001B88D638|nr:tyrosine-protein kinase HTK16-like [Gigantopelta aegis]